MNGKPLNRNRKQGIKLICSLFIVVCLLSCENPTGIGSQTPNIEEPDNPNQNGNNTNGHDNPEGEWAYQGLSISDFTDYKHDVWVYIMGDGFGVTETQAELIVGESFDIRARSHHGTDIPGMGHGNVGDYGDDVSPFHYELVYGNSVTVADTPVVSTAISHTTGMNYIVGRVAAVRPGVSVIHVTYSGSSWGGTYAKPISPVNTGVIVVNVIAARGAGPAITTDIGEKHRRYDKVYTLGDTGRFSFTASSGGTLTVKADGVVQQGSGGTYTVPTRIGPTVVELSASDAAGTTRRFYVIKTRKLRIDINNLSRPGEPLRLWDRARIVFIGLTLPVYKLYGIYNPKMGTSANLFFFNMDGERFDIPGISQYILDGANKEIFLDRAGTWNFTGGYIREYWMGSPLGTDFTKLGGENSMNGAAPTLQGDFCTLPEFSITVAP